MVEREWPTLTLVGRFFDIIDRCLGADLIYNNTAGVASKNHKKERVANIGVCSKAPCSNTEIVLDTDIGFGETGAQRRGQIIVLKRRNTLFDAIAFENDTILCLSGYTDTYTAYCVAGNKPSDRRVQDFCQIAFGEEILPKIIEYLNILGERIHPIRARCHRKGRNANTRTPNVDSDIIGFSGAVLGCLMMK